MFGKAKLVFNQRYGKKEMAVVPAPPTFDTHAYPFTRVRGDRILSDGQTVSYYGCYLCRKANGRSVRGLAIVKMDENNKLFLTNPNVEHMCGQGVALNQLRGMEFKRTAQNEALTLGTAPTEAVANMTTRLFLKFGVGQEQVRQEVKRAMGSEDSLKRALQRARAAKYPKIASYLDVPNKLSKTLGVGQEDYIIGQDTEMLVLSSPANIELLWESPYVVCDGTFAFAPKKTKQIYRVFGRRHGFWYPVVTALLTGKSERLYVKMWGCIAQSLASYSQQPPQWISAHIDCELAAINGLKFHYPSLTVLMCTFHIKSNLNTRIQNEGLIKLYKTDITVNRVLRRLGALPFVPISEIDQVFGILVSSLPPDDATANLPAGTIDRLKSILDYFRDVWLNGPLGHNFVNHFDNTAGPRTTNNAENYHSKQKSLYTRTHPKLGEWISQFQAVQLNEEASANDLKIGRTQPKIRKQKYIAVDAEIAHLKAKLTTFLSQPYIQDKYQKKLTKYISRISYLMGFKGINM